MVQIQNNHAPGGRVLYKNVVCLESGITVAPPSKEQCLDEGGLWPLCDRFDELEDCLGDSVVLAEHVEEPPCHCWTVIKRSCFRFSKKGHHHLNDLPFMTSALRGGGGYLQKQT